MLAVNKDKEKPENDNLKYSMIEDCRREINFLVFVFSFYQLFFTKQKNPNKNLFAIFPAILNYTLDILH